MVLSLEILDLNFTICPVCFFNASIVSNIFSLGCNSIKIQTPKFFDSIISILLNDTVSFVQKFDESF